LKVDGTPKVFGAIHRQAAASEPLVESRSLRFSPEIFTKGNKGNKGYYEKKSNSAASSLPSPFCETYEDNDRFGEPLKIRK